MTRDTLRHVDPPGPGDTVAGVQESIRLGYAAADVNLQNLADDLFAAAHGGKLGHGAYDAQWTGLPLGTRLDRITSAQWAALTPFAPTSPLRPALASDIVAAVAGHDFTPCFEVKPGTGTHKTKPYLDLKAAAVAHQVPVVVMTIQSYGKTRTEKVIWESSAKLRMVAAGKVRLPRMLLWREHIAPDSDWWDLLEAVKGAPASQPLPAHVVRVPQTATAATARAVLAKVTAKADWTPSTPEVPVPPTPTPVTQKRIDIAKKFGLVNVDDAAVACRKAGLPFYAACALLEKESGGKNEWGHDKGGVFSGYPGDVTPAGWAAFREFVFDRGMQSNGVGPCQITSKGLLAEMDARHLKQYVVADNMLFGFGKLADYYNASNHDWAKAGTVYNHGSMRDGITPYGTDLAAKVAAWRTRLGIK